MKTCACGIAASDCEYHRQRENQYGCPFWPTENHEGTGEPFVECVHYKWRQEHQEVRWGPPEKPSRFVTEYDEDDWETTRERTDEEYALAIASYEKVMAEWRRTGGLYLSAGPIRESATFRTASGDEAEYVGDGSGKYMCVGCTWSQRRR